MATESEFSSRVQEAAKKMKTSESALKAALLELGISEDDEDAIEVLESGVCTDQDLKPYLQPVPFPRLRLGWQILLGDKHKKQPEKRVETSDAITELIKSRRPATQWKTIELLEAYGEDAFDEVVEELKRRSKGQPVIVFDRDGAMNLKACEALLKQVRQGLSVPDTYIYRDGDEDKVTRTCRVGEWPMTMVEECPIHGDVILAGGFCEECQANWNGVPESVRQVVRIATNLGVVQGDPISVHTLLDHVSKSGNEFLFRIAKVKLAFQEAEQDGELPKLSRRLSKSRGGPTDPFYTKR